MEKSYGEIRRIVTAVSQQFRKGEAVASKRVGPLEVVDVYLMGHEAEIPEGIERVDMHFVTVGVDKHAAEKERDAFVGCLVAADESNRDLWHELLGKGPSYIALGANLGDQGLALMFMAVGQVLGLWKIITPRTFGLVGERADKAAGMGYVMISGWRQE